jgi:lysophospholipase L1-like esterase
MADHLPANHIGRILCYGDSLTAGYVAESPYTQVHHPWAPLLEKALGIPCEAVGASGWTTQQMVDNSSTGGTDACRMQRPGLRAALQASTYSLVVIMAGTNDLGTREAEKIMVNLRTLHAQCHSAGCATVAVTIPQGRQFGPWTAGTPVAFANERRLAVNAALETYASEQPAGRCLFVRMDDAVPWSVGSDDWERDGLHMSQAGYARFGAELAVKVKELAREASARASAPEDQAIPSAALCFRGLDLRCRGMRPKADAEHARSSVTTRARGGLGCRNFLREPGILSTRGVSFTL